MTLEELEARVAALEGQPQADQLAPSYININPDGTVTANFAAAQQAWQALPLNAGWTNYDFRFNPASYYQDSFGIIHIRGFVANPGYSFGTISATIGTLPVNYRPSKPYHFLVHQYNATNGFIGILLTINTDGTIVVAANLAGESNNGVATFLSLDNGIAFDTRS
jgi:hypothetical protein